MQDGGKEVRRSQKGTRVFPCSWENCRRILCRSLEDGRVTIKQHFKDRALERGFSTPDAEFVIRNGRLCEAPVYDEKFCSWFIRIEADWEDGRLEIRLGLDPAEDFELSPRISLITGIAKGPREEKEEKSNDYKASKK